MQWFVSSMNEDIHTEVNIFMYYLLFIQMLVVFSLQLILKLEVQRASRWEEDGDTMGRARTRCSRNRELSPLGTERYQCLFTLPLPLVLWCRCLPAVLGPNTYLSQKESEQLKDTG